MEDFKLEHASFPLTEVCEGARGALERNVFIDWYRFDKTDEFRFDDLARRTDRRYCDLRSLLRPSL